MAFMIGILDMKRIIVVDDHPLLREGLMRVIDEEDDFAVCGVAGSVQEALALVESMAPDLVVTDLSLPGRSGLDLIKDLRATRPALPVLVLSMHDEMIYAERALAAGARGYIMKEAASEHLIGAIRTVLGGGVFASPVVTDHFLQALSCRQGPPKPTFPLKRLTDREMEVFELIGAGKGNQEIARTLGISCRTVDAHRAHIREKLAVADSSELTRYAIRWAESGTFLHPLAD
jgi:DNA-binding NarL/FixJ family response regulator